MHSWPLTLSPLGSMMRDVAELRTYITILAKAKPSHLPTLKLTSLFYHPPSVYPKQLCAFIHINYCIHYLNISVRNVSSNFWCNPVLCRRICVLAPRKSHIGFSRLLQTKGILLAAHSLFAKHF